MKRALFALLAFFVVGSLSVNCQPRFALQLGIWNGSYTALLVKRRGKNKRNGYRRRRMFSKD